MGTRAPCFQQVKSSKLLKYKHFLSRLLESYASFVSGTVRAKRLWHGDDNGSRKKLQALEYT